MACGNENELLELADGILSTERGTELAAHVDECSRCRAILAELVRSDPVVGPPRQEQLPHQLLRDYLRADGPARELKISSFVAALALVAITVLSILAWRGAAPIDQFAIRSVTVAVVLVGY